MFAAALALFSGSLKRFFLVLVGVHLLGVVIKILLAFGVGFTTYQLGSYGIDSVVALIQTEIGTLPDFVLTTITLFRFDECINILLGAYAARLAIRGFNSASNSVRRFGFI